MSTKRTAAPTATATCEWFARCDRDAAGNVAHPILGPVPTCQRCADRLGLTFTG